MEVDAAGFVQRTFVSTATKVKDGAAKDDSGGFEFGTAAERTLAPIKAPNAAFLEQQEGLCHPNLFGDPKAREAKFLDYLCDLRKALLSKNGGGCRT